MKNKENIALNELTHETAPTKQISVNGHKYAYRTFGRQGGIPIVFLVHFAGTMDNWDPAVLNPLAKTHQIIIFNNKGVASSEGTTPDNISQMADDAVAFIEALGLKKVHLLGFSMGGFLAQKIAAENPDLIEKLILAGTSTVGGKSISQLFSHLEFAQKDGPENILINLFFSQTDSSVRAGKEFLIRLQSRTEDRDVVLSDESFSNQAKAIVDYGHQDNEHFKQLKSIKQPTLVVNGENDIMVDSINSFDMVKHIPNCKLVLWSDSGHGALFQYHEDFVREVESFLGN